jgi:IMP dehydrogenase
VRAVKRFESGMVVNPITIGPRQTLADAQALMARHRISGIPVVEADGRLVGILTNRDTRFAENPAQTVAELMTHQNLVTVSPGVTTEEARRLLHRPHHRQGYREGRHLPERDQGCDRAAACRRRDHGGRQGL